ncbi:hypothetical protein DPMN_075399 [Dreissena polymorpha]|uniref:Sushi domain-containing protein n=1 Tax=Dreissena polymorpha TaxID=45954 RepID=A0A9D3YLL3_DREPO|nr:hypothetical protein DPMN_075399 [Dreissena polymorpha]
MILLKIISFLCLWGKVHGVSCPSLPNPANGIINIVGNTAGYTCYPGYEIGFCLSNLRHKHRSLVWRSQQLHHQGQKWALILVHPIEGGIAAPCSHNCGIPSNPQNGYTNYTSTTYGSVAVSGCLEGYILTAGVGGENRTCTLNKTWTGGIPTCTIIRCSNLTDPVNGRVTYPDNTYSSIATFTCNEGYGMNGDSQRTCGLIGWNSTSPTCTIKVRLAKWSSDYPTVLSHVRLAIWSYDYRNCTLTALTTLTILSQVRLALWNSDYPNCTLKDCGRLEVTNGDVTFSNGLTTFNEIASYTCKTGYDLRGSATRTCEASGNWSLSAPTCVILDCGSLTINNGVVTLSNRATTFNETATYTCNTGYHLTEEAVRTCEASGRWSMSAPTCVIRDCGFLSDPVNGLVNFVDGTTYNRSAAYSCIPGYEMNGPMLRVCQADGTWEGIAPTCLIHDCGAPPTYNNTQVNMTRSTYGSTVSYSCNTGYNRTSRENSVLICNATGYWDGTVDPCLPVDCGLPAYVVNSVYRLNGENRTTYGSVVNYSCATGYYQSGGQSQLACNTEGQWTGNRINCTIYVAPCLLVDEHQQLTESIVIASSSSSFLRIGCVFIPPNNTTVPFPMVRSIIFYKLFFDNSRLWPTYACSKQCVQTEWREQNHLREPRQLQLCNGLLPCNTEDCGAPPTYNHTQVNVTRSTYGSTVSYTCNTGYNRTSRENSALICNATGHWDGTFTEILGILTFSYNPTRLFHTNTNSAYRLNGENRTTYGSHVNYSCVTGYYQSGGVSQLECNTEAPCLLHDEHQQLTESLDFLARLFPEKTRGIVIASSSSSCRVVRVVLKP